MYTISEFKTSNQSKAKQTNVLKCLTYYLSRERSIQSQPFELLVVIVLIIGVKLKSCPTTNSRKNFT